MCRRDSNIQLFVYETGSPEKPHPDVGTRAEKADTADGTEGEKVKSDAQKLLGSAAEHLEALYNPSQATLEKATVNEPPASIARPIGEGTVLDSVNSLAAKQQKAQEFLVSMIDRSFDNQKLTAEDSAYLRNIVKDLTATEPGAAATELRQKVMSDGLASRMDPTAIGRMEQVLRHFSDAVTTNEKRSQAGTKPAEKKEKKVVSAKAQANWAVRNAEKNGTNAPELTAAFGDPKNAEAFVAAVKKFQGEKGLKVDGYAGKATIDALEASKPDRNPQKVPEKELSVAESVAKTKPGDLLAISDPGGTLDPKLGGDKAMVKVLETYDSGIIKVQSETGVVAVLKKEFLIPTKNTPRDYVERLYAAQVSEKKKEEARDAYLADGVEKAPRVEKRFAARSENPDDQIPDLRGAI